jgi:flagellar basal body-associated protein FliL
MADDKKAPPAADKDGGDKKKGGGANPAITLVGVPLLTVGALAAAVWFGGPIFMARLKPVEPRHKIEHAEEEEEGGEEKKSEKPGEEGELVEIQNLIVDLRDESGAQRHLKLGCGIDLKKKLGEEEMKKIAPHAKDAMLEYLRALSYDYVVAPQNFPEVKKQITDRIVKEVGKAKVKRVLITDFIVQ